MDFKLIELWEETGTPPWEIENNMTKRWWDRYMTWRKVRSDIQRKKSSGQKGLDFLRNLPKHGR